MTRERGRIFAAVLALALAFAPAVASAQGVGRVTGRVVDQATNAPISQAQIVVVGTTLGARTNEQGEYTLVSVPAGQQQLRVLRLGYGSVTRPVTVVAEQTTTANFSLEEQAIALDVVVVNAVTGQEQRTREVGANISDIALEDVNQAALTKFSDVLAGRTAGVSMQGVAGTTGTAQRIRIRGANSLSLSNEPLIFVDGVLMSNSQRTGDPDYFYTGGQSVSRLNDISPETIEKVEVLKGPAASALYGTAAANGVILITTKRGQAGKTTWSAFAEAGSISDETDYPDNIIAYSVTPGFENSPVTVSYGGGTDFWDFDARTPCYNVDAADGLCSQDSVFRFNSLRDGRLTPFSTGYRTKYGVSASGGTDRATYFLSGELADERGVIKYNTQDGINLRANLTAQLTEKFNVNFTSGFIRNELVLNANDNSIFSPLINGLLGSAVFYENLTGATDAQPEEPLNYGFGFSSDELSNYPLNIQTDRVIAGLNGTYRPTSWLLGNVNVGMDVAGVHTNETLQPGVLPIDEATAAGLRASERGNDEQYTANTSLKGTWALGEAWTTSSTAGGSYQRVQFESTRCYGVGIITGTSSCGGTAREFAVDEDFAEVITIGAFFEQQFAWNDRLFLTASVRGDDNSAFGQDFGFVTYPAASASWVIAEEPWFPEYNFLSSLRLRAAFGTSGLRPNFRDAVTLYEPIAVQVGAGDVPGASLFATGNPNLKPEKTTEWEGGFDLSMFDDRLGFDFTYYHKRSKDALIERRLAPSLGLTPDYFENLGSVRNSGIEAQLRAVAVNTERTNLTFTFNATTLSNEVEELGEGVEPIIFNRGKQRHQEGLPAGAFFFQPITWSDADNNGLIGYDEVEVADEGIYIGPSLPTRMFSLTGDLTLFQWVRVSTLFDYRGGNYTINDTESFRCEIGQFSYGERGCVGNADPNASLFEQARWVGYLNGSDFGYIEKADFLKWRELAVTLSAPEQLTTRWDALRGASLTLAGRNLATWTDYTGLDPEINETGGLSNFTQGEFNTQPPVRYLTARLNFTF
jgi:TonB-dependent starch-binding outer membrane protein SusC